MSPEEELAEEEESAVEALAEEGTANPTTEVTKVQHLMTLEVNNLNHSILITP